MCRFHNMEYVEYLEQYVSKDIVAKYGSIGMGVNGGGGIAGNFGGPIDRFQYPVD